MARFLISALCLLAAQLVWAGADPLRPPPAYLPGAGEGSAAAPAKLVLEAVLLSSTRQLAQINGETVAVGQRVAGHRLERLSPREAWLSGPDGRVHLFLISDMNPEPAAPSKKIPTGGRQQ